MSVLLRLANQLAIAPSSLSIRQFRLPDRQHGAAVPLKKETRRRLEILILQPKSSFHNQV